MSFRSSKKLVSIFKRRGFPGEKYHKFKTHKAHEGGYSLSSKSVMMMMPTYVDVLRDKTWYICYGVIYIWGGRGTGGRGVLRTFRIQMHISNYAVKVSGPKPNNRDAKWPHFIPDETIPTSCMYPKNNGPPRGTIMHWLVTIDQCCKTHSANQWHGLTKK